MISHSYKQKVNEVYNKTEEDVEKYLLSKNKKQKMFNLKDYSKMYDYDERTREDAKKDFGINISRENAPMAKHFSTSSSQKTINQVENEITDNIRNNAKSKVINLRELAPKKDAKGEDINPNIDYLSDKALSSLHNRIKSQKEFASIKEDEIDISCRGKVFSYGNAKLPYWTLIFNMTSATNCPSTECKLRDRCYAKKIDKRYVDTMYRDLRNQVTLKFITARDMIKLLDAYIQTSKVRIKHIRLSEAGDFESQEMVDTAERFAKILWHKYRIKTVIYTARHFDFSKCHHLIVNASNMKVKSPTRYYFCSKEGFVERLGLDKKSGAIQTITLKNGHDRNYFFCKCNCYKCNFCYNTIEENGEDPENPTRVIVIEH